MIVTNVETGWELVFQRSHGLLAGQIAEEFKNEHKPELWVETLEAILSHDDYKEPFDGRNYVTELGAPMDFSLVDLDAEQRVKETKRRIRESKRKHRWIGLLVSRHAEELYGKEEEVSDEMRQLLEDHKSWRRSTLRQVKRRKADLEHAYQLLRWCDRCSLILVRGLIPAMQRKLEITHGLEGTRYDLWQRDDDTIGIEPWPFAKKAFQVGVEVHLATQLAFQDDHDLIEHIEQSEIAYRTWDFQQ